MLVSGVVGPGRASGDIASRGDIPHRVVAQTQVRYAIELRVTEAIEIVVVEVLRESQVVVLPLGEIPGQVVDIRSVLISFR